MSRRRRVAALAATALAIGGLSIIPMTSPAFAEPDPVATYQDRADVPLTIHRNDDGAADFIGARSEGAEPLGATTAPAKAAKTHLDRVGKALDTAREDLREKTTTKTVGGGSVTRFEQYVDGLPVLGGEVVLGLDEERGLTSASTNLSDATSAEAASASRTKAAEAARTIISKAHHEATDLTVTDDGTWLYDDDLVSGPQVGETSVYRFTVANGSNIRETVLVHAGTGRVLMHVNEIAHANRRICDNANVRRTATGCADASTTVKRREGDAATGLADVDGAYDLIGATSDLYASLGLDLTEEIGWSEGATSPAVTATTRYCEPTTPDYTPACPMANAFWNGQQIYLGQGLVVDDIVAHELTHGVIEHSSNLFYWYESGAINESLADVMGEIVDRRYATAGDSPTDWRIGEDSSLGALRSLASPTAYGQPDRMTSPLWEADDLTYYGDGGGVHTNSGVGNKTAYLISQGGTFNGRTISGIDGDDAALQKTAALYLYTIQHLVSGSQYADLGRTLATGCDALAAAGTAGFTTADCAQVRLATEATELAKSPTKEGATRPAEAPSTCPAGSVDKAALTTPTTSLGLLWNRAPDAAQGIAANDRDGNGSDFGWNPDPKASGDPTASGLTTAGIKVPAGKRTYLRFSHWYLFEWYTGSDPAHPTPQYYDGGEARLLVNGVATAIPSSAWVNGPKQKLLLNSPTKPMTGFGGDSNGWISSRVDLSSFAGKTVQLQWVVRGDSEGSFLGWYVDGLALYTCNPHTIANTAAPKISGSQRVGYTLTSSKGSWNPAATTLKYQWMRNGVAIKGATGSTYKLTGSDHAKTIHVKVTAYSSAWPAANPGSKWSSGTGKVLAGNLTPVTPKISGTRKVGRVLTAIRGEWKPAGVSYSYQWLRNGKAISGARGKTYKLRSVDRGDRIRVRVTGRKTGYYTLSRLSAATTTIR